MNRKALSVLLAGAVFLGLVGCEKKPAASRAQPPTTRGRQAPGAGAPAQQPPTTVGGEKQAPAPGPTTPGAPGAAQKPPTTVGGEKQAPAPGQTTPEGTPGAAQKPPAGGTEVNQPGSTAAAGQKTKAP
jgi:hypothetical protein